jgi:hypothetical protein
MMKTLLNTLRDPDLQLIQTSMPTVLYILGMLVQSRKVKELSIAARALVHPPFATIRRIVDVFPALIALVSKIVNLVLGHLRRTGS